MVSFIKTKQHIFNVFALCSIELEEDDGLFYFTFYTSDGESVSLASTHNIGEAEHRFHYILKRLASCDETGYLDISDFEFNDEEE